MSLESSEARVSSNCHVILLEQFQETLVAFTGPQVLVLSCAKASKACHVESSPSFSRLCQCPIPTLACRRVEGKRCSGGQPRGLTSKPEPLLLSSSHPLFVQVCLSACQVLLTLFRRSAFLRQPGLTPSIDRRPGEIRRNR